MWINAGEKKPKTGVGVLVWCPSNKCHYMAYWDGRKWQPWGIGATERETITHWQPVPTEPNHNNCE